MGVFKIDGEMIGNEVLPPFSLTIDGARNTVIYSDADLQVNLVKSLRNQGKLDVFDQKEGWADLFFCNF